MTWTKESPKDSLWVEPPCGEYTIWDDDETFWDVSGTVIGTLWDWVPCEFDWTEELALTPGWSEESGI